MDDEDRYPQLIDGIRRCKVDIEEHNYMQVWDFAHRRDMTFNETLNWMIAFTAGWLDGKDDPPKENQHHTEIRPLHLNTDPQLYQATCTCGYTSPINTETGARQDANRHLPHDTSGPSTSA